MGHWKPGALGVLLSFYGKETPDTMAKSRHRMAQNIGTAQDHYSVARYIRVSTNRQAEEGYSVDIQKERLDLATKSRFLNDPGTEYRDYVDDGYSGAGLDRPAMQQLIADAVSGKLTHVYVNKLDRLSRSQKDTLYLIEDVFIPNNVAFVSMNESFDTSTAFGRAVVGILSVFAQLERENIYERTSSGKQKAAEEGKPVSGFNAYGYTYDKQECMLVPNEKAERVPAAFDMFLHGKSVSSIGKYLDTNSATVGHILRNRTYLGEIRHADQWYKSRHQPLVSEEVFNAVQVELAKRAQERRPRDVAPKYLLTGLLRCSQCGRSLRINCPNGKRKYLGCTSGYGKPSTSVRCTQRMPRLELVEEEVMRAVFERTQSIEGADDGGPENAPDQLDILKERDADLHRQLRRLYEIFAASDGTMDVDMKDTISELKKDISVVEAQIEMEEKTRAVSTAAGIRDDRLKSLQDRWPFMTLEEQRHILFDVIDRVVVGENTVEVHFKI